MSIIYPWLSSIWQQLLRLAQQKNVPHALLFSGSAGIGKTSLVRAFSQYLLCQSPLATASCGRCRSCYLFVQHHHPDDHLLGQEEVIGIDEIRELIEILSKTSHSGAKVVTLLHADKMLLGATNALLKTLEEPLGETTIILVADKASALLPTVRSRCFQIPVPIPTTPQSLQWLQANQHQEKNLPLILALVGGAPFKVNAALEDKLPDIFMKLQDMQHSEEIQQFITSRPQEALYLFYYWLAELIRYLMQCSTDNFFNSQDKVAFQHLSQKITLPMAFQFFSKVNEALRVIANPGINKSLLVESLYCTLMRQLV